MLNPHSYFSCIFYFYFLDSKWKVAPVIWLVMAVMWTVVVTLIVAQLINRRLQNAKIQTSSMFIAVIII